MRIVWLETKSRLELRYRVVEVGLLKISRAIVFP
jgi:hypothetical protein